jgi:hypothetical protein
MKVSCISSFSSVVVLTLLVSFVDETAADLHRLRTTAARRNRRRRATGNDYLTSLIIIDELELESMASPSKNNDADVAAAFDEQVNSSGGSGGDMVYLDRMLQSSMSMSMRMLVSSSQEQENKNVDDGAAVAAFVEEEEEEEEVADTIYVERMLQSMSMSM